MSRVGEAPIDVPDRVTVAQEGNVVRVKGPAGELSQRLPEGITVSLEGKHLKVVRPTDSKEHRALHGLSRTLVANMVQGVTKGFEKVLELQGAGYRAQKGDQGVLLQVGFSHPVNFAAPKGVTFDIEGTNRIKVKGISKELVGQVAANLRAVRPPDDYKGKGIRYLGETVRLKPGKAGKKAGKTTK